MWIVYGIVAYRTAQMIVNIYKPDACVIQCGADSIAGDPLGGTNLIPEDLGCCIEQILSWQRPTIFLGGGKMFNSSSFLFPNFNSSFVLKFEIGIFY